MHIQAMNPLDSTHRKEVPTAVLEFRRNVKSLEYADDLPGCQEELQTGRQRVADYK